MNWMACRRGHRYAQPPGLLPLCAPAAGLPGLDRWPVCHRERERRRPRAGQAAGRAGGDQGSLQVRGSLTPWFQQSVFCLKGLILITADSVFVYSDPQMDIPPLPAPSDLLPTVYSTPAPSDLLPMVYSAPCPRCSPGTSTSPRQPAPSSRVPSTASLWTLRLEVRRLLKAALSLLMVASC